MDRLPISKATLLEEEDSRKKSSSNERPAGALDLSRYAQNQNPTYVPYRPLGIESKVFILVCILTLIAPIVRLLTAVTKLSSSFGSKGCLPDGTFAIPGTAGIWDTSYALSINLPVTPAAEPWTFAHAKTTNVIWDLLVGRGLQMILTFAAFHIFSRVLLRLMEGEEIPFRAYSAVSFQPGGFTAFFQLITAAVRAPCRQKEGPALPGGSGGGGGREWDSKIESGRRSAKARAAMLAMALLTLYIIALPTLLSAANGYYSVATPSLFYYPTRESMIDMSHLGGTQIGCNIELYDGQSQGMVPAWAVVLDAGRVHDSPDFLVLGYGQDPDFQDYYYRYKDAYDAMATDPACASVNDTSDCPATNIFSNFLPNQTDGYASSYLEPPLLNLQVFPPFNTTTSATQDADYAPSLDNMPAAWACGNRIFAHKDFAPQRGFDFANVTGTCNSGNGGYRWGFSYHLLLLVCVLNLVSAAAFYALWLYGSGDAEGTRRERGRNFTVRAAADIVEHARRLYGDVAVDGTWHADEMDERIYGGARGMRIDVERRTCEAKSGVPQ